MIEVEKYRCLTCGEELTENKGQGKRTFSCPGCGGTAFLVGVVDPPSLEVHLRKMRVDEAMIKLDRYLNTAFLAGIPRARIVHGKGTGIVRSAVADALTNNPLVNAYKQASPEEGGSGVTVVEIAPY